MIEKLIMAIALIFNSFSFLRHTKRATNGDNMSNGKGNPERLCHCNGIGNIAGPAIKEKSINNKTGAKLN